MDYLFGTPYQIHQPEEMYHFSSDSELLGRFLQLSREDRVLDVGTNNGVLLVYAYMQKPAALCGIDLFAEVIEVARENLRTNGIPAELYVTPIQEFSHAQFDIVISNPPFFVNSKEQLKKTNPYLRAARHADHLSMKDLFVHADRLLTDHGRLAVIYPYDRLTELEAEASAYRFGWKRRRLVYDRSDGMMKRVLAELEKGFQGGGVEEPPAFLNQLHEMNQLRLP